MTAEMTFDQVYVDCQLHAQSQFHRHILWLSGEQSWCYQELRNITVQLLNERSIGVFSAAVARRFFDPLKSLRLCQKQILPAACHKELGCEYQTVIFDGYSGFNPDHLAQIAGTLKAGGVLVLITPALSQWQKWQDPELNKLWVQPYTLQDVMSHFLNWLRYCLQEDKSLTLYSQDNLNNTGSFRTSKTFDGGRSSVHTHINQSSLLAINAQQILVEECVDFLLKNTHAVLVLTAPRGRGKSAGLGLIAKTMAASKNIMLTAANPLAVKQVERYSEKVVSYSTPAQLLASTLTVDDSQLLLVDEAAGLSVDILIKLTDRYPQVIFSTTTQGYEGTGQGFKLRFMQHLARQASQVKHFTLSKPIRWAEQDPLETWLNKLTLSNDILAKHPLKLPVKQSTAKITVSQLTSEQLVTDSATLLQVFRLLSEAHYRTAPSDLRIMLDSPNMYLWVAHSGVHLISVCLVALEGPVEAFEKDQYAMDGNLLALAMYRGQRRPRGNLVPQILIAQEGILAAKAIKVARVVRIASRPECRHMGAAKKLLRQIERWGRRNGVDYLAASFSWQQDIALFWQKQQFSIVRLGYQLDSVTASYNALVLKAIGEDCQVLNQLLTDVDYKLAYRKLRFFPTMNESNAKSVSELSVISLGHQQLLGNSLYLIWCIDQLECFSDYHRPLESVAYILAAILKHYPQCWSEKRLSRSEKVLLNNYFIELESFEKVLSEAKISGYREFVRALRSIVKKILVGLNQGKVNGCL